MKKEISSVPAKSTAIVQAKPKSFDYSKWDSIDCDSEEEEVVEPPKAPNMEQVRALASDFSSFRKAREDREKEREEYWKKHSVFNKK